MLDISNYKDAIKQLKTHISLSNKALQDANHQLYEALRTASMQSFEYVYEISIKMIKRALKEFDISAEALAKTTYKDMIRLACEKELVEDPNRWFGYRDKRNETSHSYNSATAQEIFAQLPAFLHDVDYLYARLEKLHAD